MKPKNKTMKIFGKPPQNKSGNKNQGKTNQNFNKCFICGKNGHIAWGCNFQICEPKG